MFFLGTNKDRTAFWIENDSARAIATLEKTPSHKFFLITPTAKGVTLKPVTIAKELTKKTISRKAITANGVELN
jgi:hypothetical protein